MENKRSYRIVLLGENDTIIMLRYSKSKDGAINAYYELRNKYIINKENYKLLGLSFDIETLDKHMRIQMRNKNSNKWLSLSNYGDSKDKFKQIFIGNVIDYSEAVKNGK